MPVWYYALSTTMVGIKIVLPYIWVVKTEPGYLRNDKEKIDFIELL